MTRRPALLDLGDEPIILPQPSRVSALLREFAQPLLYADPAGPSDVATIRTAMMLAMICWNLPVYEALAHPLYQKGKRTLDAISKSVPLLVGSKLRKLLDDRKTKFGTLPFLVMIEVTGSSCEDAIITAEARTPPLGRAKR